MPKTPPTITSLAQILYRDHHRAMEAVGTTAPTFVDLTPQVQAFWHKAAFLVLAQVREAEQRTERAALQRPVNACVPLRPARRARS